jgi:hypothetical protein
MLCCVLKIGLLLAIGCMGCATRFASIASQAAQEGTNCPPSSLPAIRPLREDWAFCIDTCAGTTYWQCWSKRERTKHGQLQIAYDVKWPRSHVQCCGRVASEEAALVPPSYPATAVIQTVCTAFP